MAVAPTKLLVRVQVQAKLLLTLVTPPGQPRERVSVCLRYGLPGEPRPWGRPILARTIRQSPRDGYVVVWKTSGGCRRLPPDEPVRVDVPPETAAVWRTEGKILP